MARRNDDINGSYPPGFFKELAKPGTDMDTISEFMQNWSDTGMIITSITINGPEKTRAGYMAIIKGIDEARKNFVAFRTAEDLRSLNAKIAGDIRTGQLVFKEEKPWDPDGAKAKAAQEEGGGK